MSPVLDAMRLEPFLLGSGAQKALEVAAGMKPLAAPIGGGEERHRDLRPDRRARFVVGVVERMRANLRAEVAAVPRQFFVRERLRAADELAGDGVLGPLRAEP